MRSRVELRDAALAAIGAAGEVIRRAAAVPAQRAPEIKAAGDYVTVTDRAAEEAAIAALHAADPQIPVLAEESGGGMAERVWVIDPLDGTTNFVRGFPEVGVSIALVEDGEPVVAAVAAPRIGLHWSAIAGEGACDQDGRRLAVGSMGGAQVISTGFPFRRQENRERYLAAFAAALETFEDLRRPGAASLDLAHVAAGTWEGFFELGLASWDIAAGTLLVREAGGVVSDWDGDARGMWRSGDILAGTPAWHEQMLDLVRRAAPAEQRL